MLQPAPQRRLAGHHQGDPGRRPANYQQAGLIVYGDDDNYAKMVLRAGCTGDHAARIFQFIRESRRAAQRRRPTPPTSATAFPDTVLRADHQRRHQPHRVATRPTAPPSPPAGRPRRSPGSPTRRIGLLALNAGTSAPVIDARVRLVPDHARTTPPPRRRRRRVQRHALDACRWNAIVREDPTAVPGRPAATWSSTSTTGDIYGTGNTGPTNFILQNAPRGDWTLETKVDGTPLNEQYQQGGLIVYGDDDNYVKLDFIADNPAGQPVSRRIEFRSEIGGVVQNPQPQVEQPDQRRSGTCAWPRQGNSLHGFLLGRRHHLDRRSRRR